MNLHQNCAHLIEEFDVRKIDEAKVAADNASANDAYMASADEAAGELNADDLQIHADDDLKRSFEMVVEASDEESRSCRPTNWESADKTKTLEPNDGAGKEGEPSKPPVDCQRSAGVADEDVSIAVQTSFV